MDGSSSARRLIFTFFETLYQLRTERGWEDMPCEHPIDSQIEEWQKRTGALIMSVQPNISVAEYTKHDAGATLHEREITLVYAVLYEEAALLPVTLPPIPLKEGARAPTLRVRETTTGRGAQAMAGIFPVPEGFKLHPQDEEPAPVVLLSPDCDLSVYAELFDNIGVRDEQPG